MTTTWNPSDKGSLITLSNGNLDATSSTATLNSVRATTSKNSGKAYFEIAVTVALANNNVAGLADNAAGLTSSFVGGVANSGGVEKRGTNQTGATGYFSYITTPVAYGSPDVLMFAVDFAAGKAWFGKNGTWVASGNPAAGTNHWCTFTALSTLFPAVTCYSSGTFRLKPDATSQTYGAPSGFTPWDQAALSLTATAGAYALTGIAAQVGYLFSLVASAGSYALTGIAASFSRLINLIAAAGVYAITGIAATLTSARIMSLAAGSYALTGIAATLGRYLKIIASPGSYTITGVDLIVARVIAPANKFRIRVTDYVLRVIRRTPPTLGQ